MTESVTVTTLAKMKEVGQKIVMLTAYDWLFAGILDEVGIDLILVGDSVGNNVLGYPNTLPVTMDQMVHHVSSVVRGTKRALVIADMPFMSYQVSNEEAVRNAGRFLKEAGAQAVKLEGGRVAAERARAIVAAGIPVMGHIGYLPQSANSFGDKIVQGRNERVAQRLLEDLQALVNAGVFAIVFEAVPAPVAKLLTEKSPIPTIGIGAGPDCDGQVLILTDMLGLNSGSLPRFVKCFADLRNSVKQAVQDYQTEVRSGTYPDEAHCYKMNEETLKKVMEALKN